MAFLSSFRAGQETLYPDALRARLRNLGDVVAKPCSNQAGSGRIASDLGLQLHDVDELIGLARGLLQAGAQSLILSLWDVHDESTKDFMIAFYARLQQGQSKAAAMQSAMIVLREKHPHPYHWAPFSLIGKG